MTRTNLVASMNCSSLISPLAPRQLLLAVAICLLLSNAFAQPASIPLATGWQIQSSALAGIDGAAISSSGATTAGWHAASVPETVLSALAKDGTYSNIYFGT